jgi:hypothetical protein
MSGLMGSITDAFTGKGNKDAIMQQILAMRSAAGQQMAQIAGQQAKTDNEQADLNRPKRGRRMLTYDDQAGTLGG